MSETSDKMPIVRWFALAVLALFFSSLFIVDWKDDTKTAVGLAIVTFVVFLVCVALVLHHRYVSRRLRTPRRAPVLLGESAFDPDPDVPRVFS